MKGCTEKTMKKNVSFVKAVRMREILNFPNWLYLAVLNLTCIHPYQRESWIYQEDENS